MIKLAFPIQSFSNQEERAIQTFIAQVKDHFGDAINTIILYGSKARGDALVDSDIDLLIVIKSDDWKVRNQISDISSRISLEFDVLVSPHIISLSNWQEMSEDPLSFYKNIFREGIPLLYSGS
jgi:predicted nucleotidyltransferase